MTQAPAPRIVFCALPYGYGPAAKMVVLAEHLAGLGLRPTCLAHGVACELAADNPAFSSVISAPAADSAAVEAIRSADLVVSFMDQDYASLALERGTPLHVVDSLLWMRERVPACFLQADRYWVQEFPGVRERAATLSPPPVVVGPIIKKEPPPRPRRRQGLVVNLGGYESPYSPAGDDSGYADFVLTALVASGLRSAFPDGVSLLVGRNCAGRFAGDIRCDGIEVLSLPHREAEARFAGAEMVLTSPGLTATLECFRAGVPTLFLPPQNYSQWWILKKLRAADLAPSSYHWEDAPGAPALREAMPMAERLPMVRLAISEAQRSPTAAAALRRAFDGAPAIGTDELAARQRLWFDALGEIGTGTVAADIAGVAAARERREAI